MELGGKSRGPMWLAVFGVIAILLVYFATTGSSVEAAPPTFSGQTSTVEVKREHNAEVHKSGDSNHASTPNKRPTKVRHRPIVERHITRIIDIVPSKTSSNTEQPTTGSIGKPPAETDRKPDTAVSAQFERFPSAAAELSCRACFRHGHLMETRTCLPSACINWPTSGRMIVSTSLYGADPRYTRGAIRNAELAPIVMPGWQLRFYLKSDVPQDVRDELTALGVETVVLTDTSKVGFGMNWRFLAAEDASVDAFLSRDCDSRLSLRDRYAADDWIASKQPFQVVRDHPSHASYPLMGGTWGARNSAWQQGKSLKDLLAAFVARHGEGGYTSDMDFLRDNIWPAMQAQGVAQYDSHSCTNWGAGGKPWPRPRAGLEHVGAVYLWDLAWHERAREGDCALLINNLGSQQCASPSFPAAQRKALRVSEAFTSSHPSTRQDVAECAQGGDESTGPDAQGMYGCSIGWSSAGMCSSGQGAVRLLHWRDSFIEHVTPGSHTALFTYRQHMFVGLAQAAALPPPPAQYHERVGAAVEPIQVYDGGVRYYTSLLVVDAPWVYQAGGIAEQAAQFAKEDLPRLLQVVPAETIVLLPQAAAAAVKAALDAWADAPVPAAVATAFSPQALAQHIAVQQEEPNVLHYARSAWVYGCGS